MKTKPMDTLLHFSGGLDSTLCFYEYVRDNPDKKLLVHHIYLKNHEGRQDYEQTAVNNILAWMRANGYNNFEYVESKVEIPDNFFVIYDVYWHLGIFTPIILNTYKSIKTLIRPSQKADYPGGIKSLPRERAALKVARVILGKPYAWVKPLIERGLDKGDVIRAMPADLAALTWYCRKPTKDGKVCGKCRTCLAVAEGLKNK